MERSVRDMTHGSPLRLIITFAIPMMLGNLFQQLYMIVDALVVSRAVGVEALAAVGSADWYTYMNLVVVQSFTQGFSIQAAQDYGAGDIGHLKKTIAHSIRLCCVIAVLQLILFEAGILPVLHFLHTPQQIKPMTILYIATLFAGIPAMLLYNMGASILRAAGNSRTPLIAMVIASLLNIALDILFVMNFRWGIFGAAFATVLSELVSGLFCAAAIRRIPVLRTSKEDYLPEKGLNARLLKLSLPLFMQNVLICVGGMLVASVENSFGVDYVAGYTATNKLYATLEMAAISYGYAMLSYTGQNYGAGKDRRIREGFRAALILSCVTAVVIGGAMVLAGHSVTGAFLPGSDAHTLAARAVSYRYLLILSLPLPILYILHVSRCMLQGMGDTVAPMISGLAEFGVRIVCAFLLTGFLGQSAIMWGEPAAWVAADVVLIGAVILHFRKGMRSSDEES